MEFKLYSSNRDVDRCNERTNVESIIQKRNKYKHTWVQVPLLFWMWYGRKGRTQALSRVIGCIILPVLRSWVTDGACVVVKRILFWEGRVEGEGRERCSNWVYYRTWQTARMGTMHFTSRAVMTNLVISHLTSFYGRTLVLSFCGKQHVTVRWKGLVYAEPRRRRTRGGGMLCQ